MIKNQIKNSTLLKRVNTIIRHLMELRRLVHLRGSGKGLLNEAVESFRSLMSKEHGDTCAGPPVDGVSGKKNVSNLT